MSHETFYAVSLLLLVVIVLFLLVAIYLLFADYSKDNLEPICSTRTGAAMWFYDGAYARDMNSQEKRRWCPVWTMTPTSTLPVVNQTPYSYYNNPGK